MKKFYAVFKINKETGMLIDCGWSRFELEQSAIDAVADYDYDDELVVLPIYVPTSLQN